MNIAAPRVSLSTWTLLAGLAALVVASFASLDLQWKEFAEEGALERMSDFARGFVPPDFSLPFLRKIGIGTIETLAMSLLGSLLAAVFGVLLALPASRHTPWLRAPARLLLNFLRSVPELVWAAMLVVAAGLGPLAGTLALGIHTSGVLGRLFAETLENLPPAPAQALRDNGAGTVVTFFYATLPQAFPQFLSYALYRWENNIRAATVLGVVGAGGLGQLLYFSLSLFQMRQAATVVMAMVGMVLLVDGLSYWARNGLAR